MAQMNKDPPEIEIPPELEVMWKWFTGNWFMVIIAVICIATLIAALRR